MARVNSTYNLPVPADTKSQTLPMQPTGSARYFSFWILTWETPRLQYPLIQEYPGFPKRVL